MYLDLNKELTEEQKSVKEETHRFAAEVLRPVSIELDKLTPDEVIADGSPMWEVFRMAYKQGHHLAGMPEQFGGVELSPLSSQIRTEEMGWGSADFAIALGVSPFPFTFASRSGSEQLMQEVVAPFCADTEAKYVGCWAITEPHHGSDSLLVGSKEFSDLEVSFDCTARLDGDEYVINGQKAAWVSNGTIATHACTFLSVDPGQGVAGGGVAIVPLDLPGVSRGKPLNKLGQRGLNQGEIYFDNVRLPKYCMVVQPPAYPFIIDGILATANAGMSAIFTGVARAAFEEALTYCRDRIQGGKPISEHQLVQKQLFDMFIKVESARSLSRNAMTYNATTIPPATQYSIAAKVYCTQAAFEVASDAIQLHGGYGLAKEFLVEKLFRDARASMIEDGTNEVLTLAGARKIIDSYQP
jgi:alkylation response protein AidB-like acyl-CoA dehydrogenase